MIWNFVWLTFVSIFVLFGEFIPPFKSEFQNNPTFFNLIKFLLIWNEISKEGGYKCSHKAEMCNTTVSFMRYMTYEKLMKGQCKCEK